MKLPKTVLGKKRFSVLKEMCKERGILVKTLQLCRRLSLSPQTVRAHLAYLEEKELIARVDRLNWMPLFYPIPLDFDATILDEISQGD